MKYIIGNKIGMTQIFDAKGRAVAVTLVEAAPCTVTAVRTKERDGYDAVQIGCGSRKKANKPEKGHLGNFGPYAMLREFRLSDQSDKKAGDTIDLSAFTEGEIVKVSATTKAKGFQGVVKRHGFAGGPASHGQKHSLREAGSIGATWPQRVLKGTRMAGRMGGDRRSVTGIQVVKVDIARSMIAVKGAVPGKRGAWVEIIA